MKISINALSQQIELAQLVMFNVFIADEAIHRNGQMDLFPEDFDRLRINEFATRLYEVTNDANFVKGFTHLLEVVLLPRKGKAAEQLM